MKLTVKKVGKSFTNYWETECISSVWLWSPGWIQGCLASPSPPSSRQEDCHQGSSMTTPTGLRPPSHQAFVFPCERERESQKPTSRCGGCLGMLCAPCPPCPVQAGHRTKLTFPDDPHLPQALPCPLFFLLRLTPKSEILSPWTANS